MIKKTETGTIAIAEMADCQSNPEHRARPTPDIEVFSEIKATLSSDTLVSVRTAMRNPVSLGAGPNLRAQGARGRSPGLVLAVLTAEQP
jgi:hypothetical protein